jgi:hypothetical protein
LFQLNTEEFNDLKSQIASLKNDSKWMYYKRNIWL